MAIFNNLEGKTLFSLSESLVHNFILNVHFNILKDVFFINIKENFSILTNSSR